MGFNVSSTLVSGDSWCSLLQILGCCGLRRLCRLLFVVIFSSAKLKLLDEIIPNVFSGAKHF